MLDDFGEIPEGVSPFPLSGEGLRNWLRTAGQAIFSEFETGQDALDFLRLNGVSIRTSDFYSIRRDVLSLKSEILAGVTNLQSLERVQPNSLIPMAYSISDHGYSLSDNFLYRYEIRSVNPETGEVDFGSMAVSSDRQLSFNEARDLLTSMFEGAYIPEGYELDSIDLEASFVNPDFLE